MENSKKIVLLWVLDILREYSDENHLLTYNDIKKKLFEKHNVDPNVKSIASNIDTLEAYGYEIIRVGNKGCYLGYRDFEHGELIYLVDAINSSKMITYKQANDLIQRLTNNLSIYNRKKYQPIMKDENNINLKNSSLFYVIEVLSEAIDSKKQVSFNYNQFTVDKKLKPKGDGKIYIINPYHLVNSKGKYYLICNNDKYESISNYKVENISNIKILETEVKDIKSLNNMENFNLNDYLKEHIYMTIGNIVKATIRIEDEKFIGSVIEWFGDGIKIKEKDGIFLIDIKVNEQALIYWALQYGEHTEIVEPLSTRKKIIKT